MNHRALRRLAALLVPVLAAACGVAVPGDPSAPSLEVDAPAPIVEDLHIVVIGASVSAGYGNAVELGTRIDVPLGAFLGGFVPGVGTDLSPSGGGPRFTNLGDRWFFANARVAGTKQVNRALHLEPDAIVAVDYLFWSAFGVGRGRDQRREQGLELGLETLSAIELPLVIGDLPNVDHALEGEGPLGRPLIQPWLLPSEDERARCNARIREWAASRPNVRVLALEQSMADFIEQRPLERRGNRWRPESLNTVLQPDLLHPRVRGAAWVALGAWDELAALGCAPSSLDWSVESAIERLGQRSPAREGRPAADAVEGTAAPNGQ